MTTSLPVRCPASIRPYNGPVLHRALPFVVALAALAAPAFPVDATGSLEPLRQEVVDRLGVLPTDAPKKERKALEWSRDRLAVAPLDLQEELALAAKTVKRLRKAFPGDGALAGVMDAAVNGASSTVYAERTFVDAASRGFDDKREAAIAVRAVRSADARLATLPGRSADVRARGLLRACKVLEKAMARLLILDDFDPDPDPDPDPDSVHPDFALNDLNPASATFGQAVSPRDHLGRVSAWYFAHAT